MIDQGSKLHRYKKNWLDGVCLAFHMPCRADDPFGDSLFFVSFTGKILSDEVICPMWIKRKRRQSQSAKLGKDLFGFPMVKFKFDEEWEEEIYTSNVEAFQPSKK